MIPAQRDHSQAQPFYDGDPLTRALRRDRNVPSWVAVIVFFLFANIPVLISVAISGSWQTRAGAAGLFDDFGWWWSQFTYIPATIITFFWVPDGILNVLNGLKDNHIIGEPVARNQNTTSYDDFVKDFDRVYSRPIWAIASLVLIAGFMIVTVLPSNQNTDFWGSQDYFIIWFLFFYWAFVFWMAFLTVLRAIVVLFWFNRLFREFRIDVKVLHPDGAGGLSPLGEFSVRVGYIIGIYGVSFVVASFSQALIETGDISSPVISVPILVGIVLYVIMAPIVFFAPIGAAHTAMRTAKNSLLVQLAHQFEEDMAQVQDALSAEPDELKKSLDKLEHLQKLHQMSSRFPVWPFNVRSLARFFSSVLSPVVLAMIPTVVDLVVG